MREIKFRVWDGGTKTMWYPETPSFDGSDTFYAFYNDKQKTIGWGLYDRKLENRIVSGAYEENVLMQFTGIKDATGKEIYEGDKLQCLLLSKPIGAIEVVEFNEGAFWLRHRNIPMCLWEENIEDDFTGEFKVVGNIYEK